ncbi:MAG: hypothetical protein O7I42_03900 [Alphaproteobacteria bacterium]|nr:hypothetical protein [Alphaproteobacteria bacterium]
MNQDETLCNNILSIKQLVIDFFSECIIGANGVYPTHGVSCGAVVEAAVNHLVAGSSPARGANKNKGLDHKVRPLVSW